MAANNVSPTISKQNIFNHALLFNITKSAVVRMLGGVTTNKTDKIIFNSLLKALDKHNEEK
jgi:hypothetical protein